MLNPFGLLKEYIMTRYQIDNSIFDETPVYKIYDNLALTYVGEYTDFDTADEDCYILNEEWEMS